ncbi:hypothetical protein LIER_01548 [Lithospermum erythrorhizon]|uniref:BHLH domain-containing protein n=1 Tax=Lithospermum erythrorhizon TaxID=34254 RepID=A0AAV3NLB0_LITER
MFPLPTCTQSTDLLPNPSISLANYAQKLNLATPDGIVANNNDEDAIMSELYQDSEGRPLTNGVFELTSVGVEDFRKNTKAIATEKQRRAHLNDTYAALRSLVPNPSKHDRVSVVGDAIRYIEELKRVVNELKFLVDKKICAKETIKQPKMEDGLEIKERKTENIDDHQPYNGSLSLRSSWLNRKSKNTEVLADWQMT